MNKATANRVRKLRKGGYAVAGTTHDGVVILRSPGRATHFTDKQLDAAIVRITTSTDRAAAKAK